MAIIMKRNEPDVSGGIRAAGHKIAVSVFCGGQSKRMGRPKPSVVIPGDGRTFLEKICDEIDMAVTPSVTGRYLSVRKDQDTVRKGYINVTDRFDEIGPMGGLYSVLERVKEDGYEAVLVLACDLIRYEHGEILSICSNYRGQDILFARTDGDRLQPLASIYSVSVISSLLSQIEKKEYRLRDLMDGHLNTGYYDSVHPEYYENFNNPL